MFTDILFINRSLNTNVRQVGMFWRPAGFGQPLLWYRIERCGFLWHHPLRIPWDWMLETTDPAGTRKALRLPGWMGAAMPDERSRHGAPNGPVSVRLVCDGRPGIALPKLPDRPVTVPSDLVFCADIALPTGAEVLPRDLNVSATSFRCAGLRRLAVAMVGGAPGPTSTPIRFQAETAETW